MSLSLAWLPTLNACLNAAAALLVLAAVRAVRRGDRERHRRLILTALATSALFLVSYLYYHANVGTTRFAGAGAARAVYLVILTSHTILAAAIVPLVAITLGRALRGQYPRHRALARVTFPLWVYVSVTGVIVYLMLYHLFPSR